MVYVVGGDACDMGGVLILSYWGCACRQLAADALPLLKGDGIYCMCMCDSCEVTSAINIAISPDRHDHYVCQSYAWTLLVPFLSGHGVIATLARYKSG